MRVYNRYAGTAWLYDADPRPIVTADLPFYQERARRMGGNVLELACGTGRIALALAEQGSRVWGLDLSPEMLAVLEQKAETYPEAVQTRLHVTCGDMTDFALAQAFRLILIPFRSLQLLESDAQVLQCLACARRHLEQHGRLIVHVFKPRGPMGAAWAEKKEKFDFEAEIAGGQKVTRYSIKRASDSERRLLWTDFIYRVTEADGNVNELREGVRMRWYEEEDLRGLLEKAGFMVHEAYGWFDRRPSSEGPELIFVCGLR
ncbi:class I SAM-dependent methyltransferase [Paenibacillus sp. IB182496]|uniref:Class I SAM-dependent methyltransferase n=1 Tax=Paenibacillus sabuli TaxID=2772509 RepID=A0A927BY42_9BACL|nr:class I SAM-dependent methyltransferase [Paenibacillus sabuli]MBD2848497.1 class I SAM-dependent methyltransferase [Paenibacillus sabuli]